MSAAEETGPRFGLEPDKQKPAPFPGVFWIANWMELVERFAYYGLRTVVPIYMVLAYEDGGPQFNHKQKGFIFFVWALVQSFVPIFTGGFADRYGYKLNIAISTVIKIAGYLVMGYAIELAAFSNGESIAEVGAAAGGDLTYPIFFTGAMLLALGTAIFKPGVQGLIGATMPKGRGALGWAIFYQAVNVGGFIGPLIAALLQALAWKYVFLICAAGIALNFLPLFMFAEPKRKEGEGFTGQKPLSVLAQSLLGMLKPRVFFFTMMFAGFWLMFYQLFDILPNFIDDWVDSRAIVAGLQKILPENLVPAYDNGNLNQAWMINLNALMISFFAFAFGWLTGKIRALPAMCIGILISCAAIYMLGMSISGWWTLFAIAVFSIGEMTASPTKLRYMASIAPPGKKGLFLGYANATVGIGWAIGSLVAGHLYEEGGDKVNLALRELASERGRPAVVQLLNERELVEGYASATSLSHLQTLEVLYNPASLEPPDDPATLLAFFEENELIGKEDLETLRDLDLQTLVGRIAELTSFPQEHVLLLAAASADETGAERIEQARALLANYGPTSEDAAGISGREVLRRLSKAMGSSGYAATRVLYASEFESGAVDLDDLSEWCGQVLRATDADDFDDAKAEDYMGLVIPEIGHREVAGILALARRDAAGETTTIKSLKQTLTAADEPAPPVAEPIRAFVLSHSETSETPEEGEKEVFGFFQRSRVVTMLSKDRGTTEIETRQFLWDKYEPYAMWLIYALIGFGSMIGLLVYDKVCRNYDAKSGIKVEQD